MARVAVAMSGGVDSSVAAYLLHAAGYDVHGVTMLLSDRATDFSSGASDGESATISAARVAKAIGIRHEVIDLRSEFERLIVRSFCSEYVAGRTPNPCVTCNRVIKFGLLMDWAVAAGSEYLATGHYVRKAETNGRISLRTAADPAKDQTYFLYRLSQEQLGRAQFPVGDLTKDEVRAIALKAGLPSAARRESQDLCFIDHRRYRELVGSYEPAALVPGPVLDLAGRQVGLHRGIASYTVGQRRGLGAAHGRPQYVLAIDAGRNALIIGPAAAARRQLTVTDCNWMALPSLTQVTAAEVKLRSGGQRVAAILVPGRDSGVVDIELATPQLAVTPGQAAVFYWEDRVLGGGTILAAPQEDGVT